ncbi:MAG: type II toxin-antitoxin system RelE/ParE family toxin [Candidatus Omnitrophica bacterium]|nr:type II toxin-antitoxin system RelE/ParE family toxin [Candidatus Omnitrophota bacterium]
MTYTVDILRSAQKHLSRIPPQDQDRVIAAVRALAETPHPPGCKKLSGRDAWRNRIGDYRVLPEIHEDRLRILVEAVGHRADAYR